MKQIAKYFTLLAVGGVIYACIELLFRGYTFKSMVIVGGICFVLCGFVNEFMKWQTPLPLQMLICAVIVTAVEFLAGILLNKVLHLNVWDYSQLKFNLLGQICPQFFCAWYGLSLPAIVLDDLIRWKLFDEEKPRYYLTAGKDNFECSARSASGMCRRYLENCDERECKSKGQCGECKSYMIPKSQKPCKNCKYIR